MSQELIFTSLPHYRTEAGGKQYLKLSVFVSVRLKTAKDSNLGAFPDILNWAEKILASTYQFRFNNGVTINAELIKKPDAALFKDIFHSDIRMKGFMQEDLTVKRINSFPLKHVNDFLFKNYIKTAVESPTRLLTADKFIDDNSFGVISRLKLNETEINRVGTPRQTMRLKSSSLLIQRKDEENALRQHLMVNRVRAVSKEMNPVMDFAQFRTFHRLNKEPKARVVKPVKKPEFEFHEILSVINSYPQFMRKLGFVLDFHIPYQSDIPANGNVHFIPSGLQIDEGSSTLSAPPTAYVLTSTGFYVADKPDSIFSKGFVKINTDEFSVIQVDADGAAIKANNMTENKVHQIAKFYEAKSEVALSRKIDLTKVTPVEVPEDEGLPYMRSAGIAITKNGMAVHILSRFKSNMELQAMVIEKAPFRAELKIKVPDNALYSSDLVQGYRMDIAYDEKPGKWYSLHKRQEEYTWFDETGKATPVEGIEPDEGSIELGIAEDPDDPDDVFVSETLARWEGWSLSVRKPGYAINEGEDYKPKSGTDVKRDFVNTSKAEEMKKYAFDPDLTFRVNAVSKIVPGTLPKLRFGKDYSIRIRTVDLAGNSVPLEQQTEDPGLNIRKNIRYMRYEPLASPIILVGNELRDGEFLETMVIRSNYDISPKDYENAHPVAGKTYPDYSQRYLLPPKNSQQIAEYHGKFEQAFTNNPAAAQEIYKIIAAHEGLYERADKTVEKVYQPSEIEIIYLPDPMAAGVAFFLDEGNEDTHSQEFKPRMFGFFTNSELSPDDTNGTIPGDWYNAGIVRIRLEEGEIDAKWNSSDRIFTVYLPKGYRMRIRYSTFWREKDMKQLSAVWKMVADEKPSNLAELENLAKAGQHWMVSPARELELVHAVQQPVNEPVIQALIPDRDFSETTVKINTRFAVHGESTEKVEFQAKWVDPLDDNISMTIKEKQGRNSIPDVTVHYNDDVITKGSIPSIPKMELKEKPNLAFQPYRDLPKRNITEFRADPQPESKRVNTLFQKQSVKLETIQQQKLQAPKNLVNNLKFEIAESKFNFLKQVQLRIDPLVQDFGDTRHRWVDYSLVSASRYREYFDKILKNNPSLTTLRESKWVEKINILSTARPAVPEIDYIIPTFEWRKAQNETTIRHQRLGGGLRIYLKRPWYSSGADEMLGILLPPAKKAGAVTTMALTIPGYTTKYTHWGIDPLHNSTPPETLSPQTGDFRMGPVIDDDVQYPEGGGARADVVGYPVQFDEERQMWFCDLAINPKNMYFPFIKLALARYQQHSVRKGTDDVCLSNVVMADFIQLMPDRTSILQFKKDDVNSKFTLTIEGTIYNDMPNKQDVSNYIKVTILDSRVAQPLYGVIDDGVNKIRLDEEGLTFSITRKDLEGNKFKISRDFRLPNDYKNSPFQVIVEEYERGPARLDIGNYKDRVEQSSETDKLIYADVFKVNEAKKG